MDARLPCLSLLVSLLAVCEVCAQALPASLSEAEVSRSAGGPTIRDIVTAMARHSSVDAKVRQKVRLFGEPLAGFGSYLQQGQGTDMLVRFELRMQVAGQVGSLLEVGDGRYLWRDQQMPSGRKVSRIDLRRVFTRLEQEQDAARHGELAMSMGQHLAMGGLPKLLASLADNFEFSTAVESHIGELPVFAFRGVWKRDKLREIVQGHNKASKLVNVQSPPDHLPHNVLLLVGQDDLFPYVIEYRGRVLERDSGTDKAGQRETLVLMELHEVRLGALIDSRQFVYKPGAVRVKNQTDQFLRRFLPKHDRRATGRSDAARY